MFVADACPPSAPAPPAQARNEKQAGILFVCVAGWCPAALVRIEKQVYTYDGVNSVAVGFCNHTATAR